MRSKLFRFAAVSSIVLAGVFGREFSVNAAPILFDFDNAPLDSSVAGLALTVDGLTASFSVTNPTGPNAGYAIWPADVWGFTPGGTVPGGFSGLSIYPTAVYSADLNVTFYQPLTGFSILYASVEYGSDTSSVVRVTADMNGVTVGSNSAQAGGGTWPTATLSFSSAQEFNHVLIQWVSAPSGAEDWAPIFAADNMIVTLAPSAVPLPATLPLFATGLAALGLLSWRRKRKTAALAA